jgi:BirA family biotin operon repressor/biotin-[acetyl-CoA-carboxylase] ligase
LATRYSLIAVDTVPSTQDVARDAFADDTSRPVLVTAQRQEAGRGRTGVGWINADRAVAASLACAAPPSSRLGTLPLVAGLAMRTALASVGVDVLVKWPNDLMNPDGVKVGGILSESDGAVVVIGAGVNLFFGQAPPDMAGCFDHDPGPETADRIAAVWAETLLAEMESGDPWDRASYREASMLLGRPITWEGGSGTAVDIAEDGALVVAVGTDRVELHSGAVRLVRRATLAAEPPPGEAE